MNVRRPTSIALHELFDNVNEDVQGYVDLIAERVVHLGGVAQGTARSVEVLSSALAGFGKLVRSAITQADDVGDADTADIFIEISRGTDRWLWFVESHLQDLR